MSDSPYAPTTAPLTKDEVVASYIENRPGQGQETEKVEVATFVIDDCYKNTASSHNKEATITLPFLVKRTKSRDLVPRPWTSIKQMIAISYCSFLCCILTGAFANHYAWESLRYKELGLLSESKKLAASAALCIYISFALGMVMIIAVPLIVVCGALELC